MTHILAIDPGNRLAPSIFDAGLNVRPWRRRSQHYPASGWVEHDPADLWAAVMRTARAALAQAGLGARRCRRDRHHQPARDHLVWDRATGADRARHRLAGPPDRRHLQAAPDRGHEKVTERTGLLLDLFLRHQAGLAAGNRDLGARRRAAEGDLAFGTVDSFLIWQLTGGRARDRRHQRARARCFTISRPGPGTPDPAAWFEDPR